MAGKADIALHYDEDTRFFRTMLGESLAYSCGNWEEAQDLYAAQNAKLAKMVRYSGAVKDESTLLDIGCGWGSLALWLKRNSWANSYTGITISEAQKAFAADNAADGSQFVLGDCFEVLAHKPSIPYDCAISIGAFEHFASPADYKAGRHLARYGQFFDLVRGSVRGGLGLQTIVVRRRVDPADHIATARVLRFLFYISKYIFPNSLLPSVDDLLQVAEERYDVAQCDVHSDNYARTCAAWLKNLENHRSEIAPQLFAKHEKYLKLCIDHFNDGFIGLAQLSLTPKG